jgi:prevent-host-death family protein
MVQTWQLQEAKNKFSQVVESAINSGPQIITRHGVEVAIVLSCAKYERMVASKDSPSSSKSPLGDVELNLSRDKSEARGDTFCFMPSQRHPRRGLL